MTFRILSAFLLSTVTSLLLADTRPFVLSTEYADGEAFMQIKTRGTLQMDSGVFDGFKLGELSGLAWDTDEALLYAVSNHGELFHIRPRINAKGLLHAAEIVAAFALRNADGSPLQKRRPDSEGLDILNGNNGKKGDAELLISFEGTPRIARFSMDGKRLGDLPLPGVLQQTASYEDKNKGLESILAHPTLGTLTAPERPLRPAEAGIARIYALDGRSWRVPQESLPDNSIVAMETQEDGSVLLLERSFASILKPFIISLRQVWLNDACLSKTGTPCEARLLARLDSSQGWSLDNFEGLARHEGNRYFMVSDNNSLWFQNNLLTYFEVLPHARTAPKPEPSATPR